MNCFRFSTDGPFKRAWETMENNEDSFWSSRDVAIERMLRHHVALFENVMLMQGREEVRNCLIKQIPKL